MPNLILQTDSYKQSHYLQYPPDVTYLSSYIEARAGSMPGQITQFFGLQAFLTEYLANPIVRADIEEARDVCAAHGVPFNEEGWKYIYEEHDGFLPLEFQALEEGDFVPRGVPMIQIRNTDPKCAWLVSHIETALLRAIWYPSSVATRSAMLKVCIYDAMLKSCDTLDGLPFKLHDFGARGVSSGESAALGGLAHLINFHGTDTLEALSAATAYYDAGVVGFSLPASEHSTMTAWGQAREADAYENMVDQFGSGLFSIVSDSYDLLNAVDQIFGVQLRDKILKMDGKLIVRPDSGDPVRTPLAVIELLWDRFGGTINSKGYKVLNPKVGVIQGDGLNADTIAQLLEALLAGGYSLDNIAFGMGGGLLQEHLRDDMRFAMKVNAMKVSGSDVWQDVQKKPATDLTKTSKAGRQAVVYYDGAGELVAMREDALPSDPDEPISEQVDNVNYLKPVWRDGAFVRRSSFEHVRRTAHKSVLNFHQNTLGAHYEALNAAE